MNITPKQVLTLAAKYIGYKEKASNKDLYSFEDNAGRGNFTMFQAELDKAKRDSGTRRRTAMNGVQALQRICCGR